MANVLVTGAAGFLGSAVCRAAASEGARVVGLVRSGELREAVSGIVYRDVDWRSPDSVTTALARANPDRIVHCAGATPRTQGSVAGLYDANVSLVWRLLDAVSCTTPGADVVVVSSAAVYGPAAAVPTVEDEPLNPTTHYAWSKVLAEEASRAYAHVEGVRVCIARPFNLLGQGEPGGSVLSDVVDQIEAGASVVRVRELASVRDYLDVDDAARALLLLAGRGQPGQAYNVCSGQGVSVAELVREILRVWGSPAKVEVADPSAEGTVSIGSRERLVGLGFVAAGGIGSGLGRLLGARHRVG